MKKLRLFVITLGITLSVPICAYAALPYANGEQGLLVMGDKAYSVSYIQSLNDTDIKSLNDRMKNYSHVYYVHNGGTSASPVESIGDMLNSNLSYGSSENSIYLGTGKSTITYTGINGQQTYSYDNSTGQYNVQTLTATIHISVNSSTDNLWTINVNMSSSDIKGLDDYSPTYFKLEHSSDIERIGTSINCLINKQNSETIYILSADKKVIAYGQVDTTNTYGSTYSKPISLYMQSYSTGDVVGNIDNNGYVSNDDNWVYYSNTADNGKIYRTKFDGMANEQITNDKAGYINVVGENIYYTNYSDGGKIYKVKTDGTGRTKLCDDVASYINVSGNYIYYSNHTYSNTLAGGRLCRVSINGGTGQVLSGDNVAFINVEGDTIYYTNLSDNKYLYSINTDGLCKVKISSDGAGGATFPVIYGDYIYYLNYNDSGKIYKIQKDGSYYSKVSDTSAKAMNIAGDAIYYSNYSDGNKLYKVNVDGTSGVGPLFKDSVELINIAGGNIYYTKSGKLSVATLNSDKSTYTTTVIAKPTITDKISKVNNITDNVLSDDVAASYDLPDRISAIMTDNSIKEIVVVWDKTKYTKKGNIYTYTGTLLGYGTKVTATLTVTASNAISASNVTITNNPGGNDTIVVGGLTKGDTIKVYSDSSILTPMVSGKVDTGTSLTLTTTLNTSGGSVWITKTSATSGSTESKRVEVAYSGESIITNTFTYTPTNNNGAADTLQLVFNSKYTPASGDVIRIYKDSDLKNQLGSDYKVQNSSNTITISNLDFGAAGGTFYVTLQSSGKSQSQPEPITVSPSPNYTDVNNTIASLQNSSSSLYFYKILNDQSTDNSTSGTIEIIKSSTIKLPVSDDVSGNTGQVVIQWTSGNTNLIQTSTGKVYRPSTDQPSFKLTAKASEGDASATCDFTVQVPSVSADEAVNLDSVIATLQGELGFSTGDTAGAVTGDITLPLKGQNGSTITWTQMDTDYIKIGAPVAGANSVVATIKRPGYGKGDANVTLQATVSKSGASSTKTASIPITIRALTGSLEDLYAAQNVILSNNNKSFSDGQDAAYVLTNNGSINSSTGISITWTPGDTSLFNVDKDSYGKTTGKVLAIGPTYTVGSKSTTLKATLTKNGQSVDATVNATATNIKATASEYAQTIADAISTNSILLGQGRWDDTSKTYMLASGNSTNIYLPYTSNGYGLNPLGNTSYSSYLLSVSPIIKGQPAASGDTAAKISWSVSASGACSAVNPSAGSDSTTITSTGTGTVTLTATITCTIDNVTASAQKVFYINVK